jgi:hypothetical protein
MICGTLFIFVGLFKKFSWGKGPLFLGQPNRKNLQVWLPEEFMEGRIGVAITVLLTLSTESAGAREHLPSVSYLKAIDLWFGFITGFVFFTLLQTLFVIGFDKRANQLVRHSF